ncbi:carboxypeptidase-like regulatory domain-containing protein [Flavobacterium sp. LaA7.5]|nr:carboxypeptidase-like regulatory domain-containing protein [Flavobacterium salilacus subsp. altitudinum]
MKTLTLLLFFFGLSCQAQFTVTGVVRESEHNNPLPFATITTDKGKTLVADVDGKFSTDATEWFTVSYIGYTEQKRAVIPGKKSYTILLAQSNEELKEVVIEQHNKVNALIRKVIYKKPDNNPRERLESFQYKTYNKLLVTANPDSIAGKIDSIYTYERLGKRFDKLDSTDFKFKKLIEQRHLYQTEKVSEFKFNKKQGLKENVLATRMAGFKQPLYEVIGLTLQSYSVYGNNIELVETKYAGPLADDALFNYQYKILDTVAIDGRNVYVVYFTPKREKKKRKLEGLLYIDSENYGIAKAIFRVKNVLDITSTHVFNYNKELNLWFPDEKKLKIVKGNNKNDIKILGETIKFDGTDNSKKTNREKDASDYLYLISESVNFEQEYNIPVKINHPDVAIEIKEEAINRPESYWNRYRIDTMDNRSIETYIALDSLVAKENWEKKIFLGKKIINGYVPLGMFDLDLRDIIRYNNYEGFRLGLGGTTNNKLSEYFKVNGYGVYGTKDGAFKYSLGTAVRIGKFSNSWIGGSYTEDVREIASTSFATDKKTFKIYDPRPINISTFYGHKTWQAYLESKLLPKTESHWQISHSSIDPKFNYVFSPDGKTYNQFNLATATAAIQWNPFSDFMQTPAGRIEVDKRFPKFTFQYTQAIAGILDSDLTFGKLDFRVEIEKNYLNGQKTSALIQTGIAIGDTPLTHLYSTSPNNLDRDGVLERITFAGKNSFETMYFNEFFSSQYAIVQLKHGMSRFTVFNAIKLSPMFVTRFAWGNMENKDEHGGIEYNTLEKGYYESGIEFNEIYKGLGFTAFYRYGPYHLPQPDRNISIKVSFVLNLF